MALINPDDAVIDLTPLTEAIASKVSTTDFEQALAGKVDGSAFEQALAGKVDSSAFEQALASKVSTTDFEQATTNFEQATTDFEQALASKVSTTDFEQALTGKVDSATLAELQTALQSKVSGNEMATFVDTEIGQHVEADDPHSQYVLDVDLVAALATKADVGSTGASLGDPAPAIASPDASTIDSTYGAEEAQVITTMRTALNKMLDVMRLKGLIKASLVFTVSQSSAYAPGLNATYATLTDGDAGTGAGTNSGTSWVQADFGAPIAVSAVSVAGGSLPSWGGVSAYLNGATIQSSTDGVNWTTQATVSGVSDSGPARIGTFSFPTVTARYFRLYSNSYLSTTELGFA